jgi:uncharacterized protein (DUF779 family)
MFEVPGTDIVGVHVSGECVDGKSPITYIRRPKTTNAQDRTLDGENDVPRTAVERGVGRG